MRPRVSLAVLALAVGALALNAHAWVLSINSKEDAKGDFKTEEFHSAKPENGCFNLAQQMIDRGVFSFQYCTTPIWRCSLTFHSEKNCDGYLLGETSAGKSWDKFGVSEAGSKMKSFQIVGCITIPIPGKIKLPYFDVYDLGNC
ncbi:hypothetical protein M427DRAFT_156880 [Gonapodya prolifera JEL478]|uniref:Uncharacterized protein n=1 Tax=Gonapodya prolifera (strain JEL478) TaxID=1344416 RepID=A0A139A8Y7_GONPJ|nr:hypothetical protein M427DRAFT_156880 [Gonapodya prolifera JEL478]|eukprot:KXS13216.1 hypothetical protein M427DRAFT_156880 [Gonapodya prolifera JEL478]